MACPIQGVRDDTSIRAMLSQFMRWGSITQDHLTALTSVEGQDGARARLEEVCTLEHDEHVIAQLAEFLQPAREGESALQREERLAIKQNELNLWEWADGSPICAKSFLFHTFGFVYDHKTFRWSQGCNQWCNEPRLSVIIPISDTLRNIKWVQGYVIDGWMQLAEPFTLQDGTVLLVRIRFLKGDAPIQQRRHGVNTGNAHYRCWLCNAHVDAFVDLRACCEECDLRDLDDLAKAAKRVSGVDGCEDQINPRGLRIAALRKLMRKLGVRGGLNEKRASVENAAVKLMQGVNSTPGILGNLNLNLSDIKVLMNAEGVADEPLHVLKGMLAALRKLIKEKLSTSDRRLWNQMEDRVDGGKEEYSGSDYRKWIYASPSMWRAVQSRSATLESLQQATINLAHATKFCFRQGYPGWHREHGKIVLRAVTYIYKCVHACVRACVRAYVRARGGL